MFTSSTETLILFIVISILLIILLISFVTFIVYRYQQKQNTFYKDIEKLKTAHANQILLSQLEIQEQTFESISREIHDNIGQKLTLAKLQLNTLEILNDGHAEQKVSNSVAMISDAIKDLRDISRSMNSEIILNNGFITGMEYEVEQLNKSELFLINFEVIGSPVYMAARRELLLFRMVQEALHNIIKHACAKKIEIRLRYCNTHLNLSIADNGIGFEMNGKKADGAGIGNMKKRALMLHGIFEIESLPGNGTGIHIEIPIYENEKML